MQVKFETSVPLDYNPFEVPVLHINGSAINDEIEVATLSMYSVDYRMIADHGERDFLVIMDAISHSLMEISDIFYTGTGLKKNLNIANPNLLHIESIHVSKPFRGCGVGYAMIDRALRVFGPKHGIVTVKPYPTQLYGKISDEYKDDFSDLPKQPSEANKKLEKLYQSWGFMKYARSKYYFMPMDCWEDQTAIERPTDLTIMDTDERVELLNGEKE